MIKLKLSGLSAEATHRSLPFNDRDIHSGTAVGTGCRSTETLTLAKRIRLASSMGEAIDLRNRIVLLNLGLVPFTLQSLRLPTHRNDDAFSEGICGLIESAGRFDPERGSGFATFALPRIRGRVVSWLSRRDNLTGSENVGRRTYLIRRATRELPADLHYSAEILAQRTGLPVRTVKQLKGFSLRPLSLDGEAAHAIPSAGPDPREAGALDDDLVELRASLHLLPDRLRKIVDESFGLGGGECRSQQAIAVDLGVTRQRVSQLLAEALVQLRRHLER